MGTLAHGGKSVRVGTDPHPYRLYLLHKGNILRLVVDAGITDLYLRLSMELTSLHFARPLIVLELILDRGCRSNWPSKLYKSGQVDYRESSRHVDNLK